MVYYSRFLINCQYFSVHFLIFVIWYNFLNDFCAACALCAQVSCIILMIIRLKVGKILVFQRIMWYNHAIQWIRKYLWNAFSKKAFLDTVPVLTGYLALCHYGNACGILSEIHVLCLCIRLFAPTYRLPCGSAPSRLEAQHPTEHPWRNRFLYAFGSACFLMR